MLHYIHLQDHQCVQYVCYHYKIKYKKKNDPWFTMGKNIKSYAKSAQFAYILRELRKIHTNY